MLVLARQEGDGITFPDLNLEVEVLRIQGRRVQLGVHAARELKVMRSELLPDESKPPCGSCEDPIKITAMEKRLRELSTQLAMAKAQWERGDIEGVEQTLRSMAARTATHENTAMRQISVESEASPSRVSEKAASYDCRSSCDHLQVVHPDCPLKETIRGMEGLAC